MRLAISIGFGLVLVGACADAPLAPAGPAGPWSAAEGIPTRVELTCANDGSVTLSTESVQPRPDGVHIRVVNQFAEPVSVEGFDADPGTTHWVFSYTPGTVELMCWPFSQHTSGDEPIRHPVEVVDPVGLFFDGSVSCEFEMHSTGDHAEAPVDQGPPPLSIAKDLITGLQPADELKMSGYPKQEGGSIVVIRNGEVVASYGIVRFEGEPWSLSSGRACEGTGLPFEGECGAMHRLEG